LNLIRQKHARGCGPAALAMVTGHVYEEICKWFGTLDFSTHGIYVHGAHEYLAEHGFAVQVKHKFRQFFRTPSGGQIEREPWPALPFANRHLCQVLVSDSAPCDHFVAMTADGTVLDPATDEPRKLSDYFRVNQIAGVWRVAA